MIPRSNSILVTFDDGSKILILPREDEKEAFSRFDKSGWKYTTEELSPLDSFEWLKGNTF